MEAKSLKPARSIFVANQLVFGEGVWREAHPHRAPITKPRHTPRWPTKRPTTTPHTQQPSTVVTHRQKSQSPTPH